MQTLQDALSQAYQLLVSIENPRLDTEILLAHILKKPRSYLLTWANATLTIEQTEQFQYLLKRRLQGEPIAYILQEKEFWSLNLEVTPDTLIPRPDTELLVELILEKLPKASSQTIADLGTGSGAIALAIAKERPNWEIIATDNYLQTLAVAQRNAKRLGLENIHFYQGNWCEALPNGLVNAIVSNPPYIAEDDIHLNSAELSFEPQHALISGKDGLTALTCIIQQAKKYLAHDGWLLLEHGFDQSRAVQQLLAEAGYKMITSHADLNGHLRVTTGIFL
jgi:release factor glutamine methyltransferase